MGGLKNSDILTLEILKHSGDHYTFTRIDCQKKVESTQWLSDILYWQNWTIERIYNDILGVIWKGAFQILRGEHSFIFSNLTQKCPHCIVLFLKLKAYPCSTAFGDFEPDLLPFWDLLPERDLLRCLRRVWDLDLERRCLLGENYHLFLNVWKEMFADMKINFSIKQT